MAITSYPELIAAAGVQDYDFRKAKAFPTPRALHFRRTVQAAAIAANAELQFFHRGLGDTLVDFGATSGTATLEHTNMQSQGRLADGELFICTGIAFQLPHNVTAADYLALADQPVTWCENANTTRKALGQFEDFPPQVRPDYILRSPYGATDAASTVEERLIRSSGRAYMTGSPLFYIRGGVAKNDQGYLELKVITGFTPSAGHIKAKLYGVYFQKLAGG